jgi:hypothetical protein
MVPETCLLQDPPLIGGRRCVRTTWWANAPQPVAICDNKEAALVGDTIGRTRSSRTRLLRASGIGILLTAFGAVATPAGAAAAPADHGFRPVPAGSKAINLPPSMADEPVTVLLQLGGDPVAVADVAAAAPLTSA